MDDPLKSKKPEDMTRRELRIMAMKTKLLFPSNPIHERLFDLEEEDRLENQRMQLDNKKTQDEIKSMTIDMRKMTIWILIFSACAVILSILAFFYK
jgi:hypothetical protein